MINQLQVDTKKLMIVLKPYNNSRKLESSSISW